MTTAIEHKNGPATLEEAYAVPVPEQTRTYVPVSNQALLEMLQKTANARGLQLGAPQLGLAHKGQRMFGSMEITNQDHFDSQVRLMLGVRNSYNKTMSIGVCFGSKVFVCSNMVFTGYTSEDNDAIGQVHHRHQAEVWKEQRATRCGDG